MAECIEEVIAELVASGAKPTGSRYVGGFSEESDFDYFIAESDLNNREADRLGFKVDDIGHYLDECGFVSLRHTVHPLNLIVMADAYFTLYDFANERVREMKGSDELVTRDGRVKWFKHFLSEARQVYASV